MPAAMPHGPAPMMAIENGVLPRPTTTMRLPYYLVATRSHADEFYRRFDERFYAIEIGPCLGWQIFAGAGAGGRRLPSVEPLIARHHVIERREIAGKLRMHLTRCLIARADG